VVSDISSNLLFSYFGKRGLIKENEIPRDRTTRLTLPLLIPLLTRLVRVLIIFPDRNNNIILYNIYELSYSVPYIEYF